MMSGRARQDVEDRVSALVGARFGGDYGAAFEHYRLDRQGRIDWAGLTALLVDAGAANLATGAAWAGELILDGGAGTLAAALGEYLIRGLMRTGPTSDAP